MPYCHSRESGNPGNAFNWSIMYNHIILLFIVFMKNHYNVGQGFSLAGKRRKAEALPYRTFDITNY
jgi:hypothetical protein